MGTECIWKSELKNSIPLRNRYESFIEDMNNCSHTRELIRETDSAYVRTFRVKSGTAGKVIELCCPGSEAMSVFGKNQAVPENTTPYFFSLRCFDKHGRELGISTRMNFKKVSKHGGISRAWRAYYCDLLPVKAVRYSFPEGMYLSGDEFLELEVLNPDIDIERIELSMEADIFSHLNVAGS